MLRLFDKLRALRALEKPHVDFAGSVEDYHLIGEIGYHQAKRKPLTLKQLSVLDVSSIATVQRRLRRLKQLGLVTHREPHLGGRHVGAPRPGGTQLLLQPREECGDVGLLVSHSAGV